MAKRGGFSLGRLLTVVAVIAASSTLLFYLYSSEPVSIVRPPIETKRPNPDIMLMGHRGASKFAPENTLPSMEKAIELGLDYAEVDIRYTSDGVPVLMHDFDLDRTTDGTGPIHLKTLREVKALDAGSWFGPEFAGTQVPTLEEALQTAKGRICIFWDTKAHPQQSAISLFKKYGFDRDCLLISFGGLGIYKDTDAPEEIVEYWPEAPFMPQVKDSEELANVLDDYPYIRAIGIPFGKVTPELIDQAHAAGLLVGSTTLVQYDHHHAYKKLIDMGVDIVMLDHIDSFYEYLKTGDLSTPAAERLPAYNRNGDSEDPDSD